MNKKGFTLAEVVVTLAILSIMATIAIPSYISWLPKHKLQTSVRQIYDDLNLAKMEAVKRNTDVCITFNAGNDTYRIFVDADSSQSYVSPPDTILKDNVKLEKDVDITGTTFGGTVGFNNRGMLPTGIAPGQVRLSNPTGNKSVAVNLAGGISIP